MSELLSEMTSEVVKDSGTGASRANVPQNRDARERFHTPSSAPWRAGLCLPECGWRPADVL